MAIRARDSTPRKPPKQTKTKKKKKTSRDLLPIRLPHQVTHQEPSLLARIRVENTQHPLRSEPEHCTRDSLQSSNRRIAQNQKQKRAGHELPLLKSGSFSITCRNQRGRAARANRGWANPETGIKIEPFCRRKSRGSRRSLPPPSLPPSLPSLTVVAFSWLVFLFGFLATTLALLPSPSVSFSFLFLFLLFFCFFFFCLSKSAITMVGEKKRGERKRERVMVRPSERGRREKRVSIIQKEK